MNDYKYLNKINNPRDLDSLSLAQKVELCNEIRNFIIEKVTKNGGHLASNLGAVELTVAAHSVFDIPNDRIIFDVGHQAYTHKILTGRKDLFDSLRKRGGLSGFTKREESEYDCFGAGHSSTSLSAALGFCESDKLSGSNATTIVVLGDGAFTGGMIHEALNNCKSDSKLVIILNENEMSISKNTGHFADLIAKIRTKKGYYKAKHITSAIIKKIPFIGNKLFVFIRAIKKSIKNKIFASNYFENLGLYYLGPCDGNDLHSVITLLEEAKQYGKACIIHVKTKKGKGCPEAEQNPSKYHGIPPIEKVNDNEENFSSHMGKTLSMLADNDNKICAVTAAMSNGTGLDYFSQEHPDRFFDVGIAEEHALTFSAGLASNGFKPYFAVYSSFLQRGFDNIIHDISLQNLPVRVLIDRAGIAASDGPTHNGVFDVPFLSTIPNVDIYTPSCFESLDYILSQSLNAVKPTFIRYSNCHDDKNIKSDFIKVSEYILCNSNTVKPNVIITYGKIVSEALKTAKEYDCSVILLEKLTPYDDIAKIINDFISDDSTVVFLEESMKINGAGMIFGSKIKSKKYSVVAIDGVFDTKQNTGNIYSDYNIGYKNVIEEFEKMNG